MEKVRGSTNLTNGVRLYSEGEQALPCGERAVRVLMVEDSSVYQACVRKYLSTRTAPAFNVSVTSRLSEAVDYLKNALYVPDVILVDLSLPDSSGLDTLSKIIRHAEGIPVIVLTASEGDKLGLESVRQGAHDYLVKQLVSNDSLARCILYAIERRRLEESKLRQEAIRDFTDTLAHDLRIPMIGAEAVLDALLKVPRVGLTADQTQLLSALQESNRKQLALVRKLIEVYKYEPDCQLDFADVELEPLLLECIDQLENKKGSKISCNVSETISFIKADYEAMHLLFSNLLDNAARHGEAGAPISVTACERASFVAVDICNQGKALPDELKDGTFQHFWRTVPGKRYVAKTGIGLYLCDRIVNVHQGQIRCSSNEKQTTFTILLPKA